MESNEPLWSATASSVEFPRLAGDAEVDVVIIGGGITGLTAALLLSLAGKRALVVEARRIGSGVTHRSTAHLTEAVDTRYHEIASKFGAEGARLVAESSRAAIESVAGFVSSLAIPCDFVRRDGYLFGARPEDAANVQSEAAAAEKAGLPVEYLLRAPLPVPSFGVVRFPDQAQVHIARYLAGLAAAAAARGVAIHEESRVIAVEDGEPCIVHLEHGPKVRAAHVFAATHAPLNRVFLQTKIHAYRSYVLAYEGLTIHDGLFWDTLDPYHYFSTFSIDGKPWLILGGEDHKTGATTATRERFDALDGWARSVGLVPASATPRHLWSAQVEEPVDGLPFIGRNSLSDNVFVATGFSGNGITFGTIAARIVTDLVLGRPNPWAELYTATRVKPSAVGTFVSENVDFPLHLVSDHVRPPEAKSLDDIAPGEGKTVRVGGQRLAVYREPSGRMHAVSSVCTHLGCTVKFNAAETTWDCPCHGSRFGIDGKVLDGPATRALETKNLEATVKHSEVMPVRGAAPQKSEGTND